MSEKKKEEKQTKSIEDDLKTPPGEFLVPCNHGIIDEKTWIKDIHKKIKKKND